VEAERASDDAVLQRAEAASYADQLITLAARVSDRAHHRSIAMAKPSDLAARIRAVLDHRQRRGPAGVRSLSLVCVVSVLLVATMSPLRIVSATQRPADSQSFAGSLTDPLGRRLPDTRLTLWNTSTQQPIEGLTDQMGRFTFNPIRPGEYRVQVHGFGEQGRIVVPPGEQLIRDIAIVMTGLEDTLTVFSNEAPAPLPPLPSPQPAPETLAPSAGQAALNRCAEVSMFCRVTPPVQTSRVRPVYPTKQREGRTNGTVTVEARVGTDGLVKDFQSLAPADPDFVRATVDALRRWQFTAMRFDGVPVEVTIRVTANFVVR
jgi:TonB family protein